MEAIKMKQKPAHNLKARNSFCYMSAVPMFIVIMLMAPFASIFSEAAASDTLAYIPNTNGLTVLDTITRSVVTNITSELVNPKGVAVNSTGTFVYVTNVSDDSVSVIDTGTNSVVGNPIPVGSSPEGIAINTAGTFVYVANVADDSVSVIDTGTNSVVGSPIPVGGSPVGIAVNSAGTYVYVARADGYVSVIDTGTNSVPGSPIPAGSGLAGIAVNSAGTYAYTANSDGSVTVIDTSANTNSLVQSILLGFIPGGIALNPAGTYLYVTDTTDGYVSVIDTGTNSVVGSPIFVGAGPAGIAVNSAGTKVYTANKGNNTLSVIDTTTSPYSVQPISIANGVSAVEGQFLSPGTFSDVSSTNSFYNYIEAIYQEGITTGCVANVDYECTSPDVTRDQMAAFLIRAIAGWNFTCTGGVSGASVSCTTMTAPYFSDVPNVTANPFFPYIQKLKELAITTGCGSGDYECTPNTTTDYVTRDQMAAFLVRATQVEAGQGPETFTCNGGVAGRALDCSMTTPYFSDVSPANPFFKYIQKLKELGITTGCGNGDYECPSDDNVTRDQMAAFLARAFLGMK